AGDSLINELADGELALAFGKFAGYARLDKSSPNSLKKSDLLTDRLRRIARGSKSERLGKLQHCILIAAQRSLLFFRIVHIRRFTLLPGQNPVDGVAESLEALQRRPGQSLAEIVPKKHGAHDFMLFLHHRDGLFFADAGLLPVGGRVIAKR